MENEQTIKRSVTSQDQELKVERSSTILPKEYGIFQQLNSGLWYYLRQLDIFTYIPVPKTNEVSTPSSQIATIVAIVVIFGLFVYQIVILFKDNQPIVNSYSQDIDPKATIDTPDIAFGFYIGEDLSTFLNDDTYFEYSVEQYYLQKDSISNKYSVSETRKELVECNPDWLSLDILLYCPQQKLKIQNYLTQNADVLYPIVKIIQCDEKKQLEMGRKCKSQFEVDSILSKGRLLLFMEREAQKNVITGEHINDSFIMYQFFVTRNMLNCAETIISQKILNNKPDYASSFSEKKSSYKYIQNYNQYLSNVNALYKKDTKKRILQSQFNSSGIFNQDTNIKDRYTQQNSQHQMIERILQQSSTNLQKPYFLWWITQDKKDKVYTLTFKTVPDVLSFLGGLWGVICAVFILIFMKRNAELFYEQKQSWKNFDKVINTKQVNDNLFISNKVSPILSAIELTTPKFKTINLQQSIDNNQNTFALNLQDSVITYAQNANQHCETNDHL